MTQCGQSPRVRQPGMWSEVGFRKDHCEQTKLVQMMEFQISYLKSLKMRLLKCCTQYAKNFENLLVNSEHRPGKGQHLFQSQRRAMTRNVKTTVWLHSFHMLVRLRSKSIKLGFNSMWTENFHKYKLDLEKARGTRNQIANHHRITEKARGFQKNIYSVSLAKAFDCVDQNKMESSERDAKNRTPYLSLQKAVCRSRSNN